MESDTQTKLSNAFDSTATQLLSRIPLFNEMPAAVVSPRDTMHGSWHVDLIPELVNRPQSFRAVATTLAMQDWLKPDGIHLITVLMGWIPLRWRDHKTDNVFVVDVPINDQFYNVGLYIRATANFLSHEPRIGDTIRSELEQDAMYRAAIQHGTEDCNVSGLCLSVPMHLAQDLGIAG